MTLGVMQPYFFPYLGYFSLIDSCEKFVFFDTVQFVRKSWMSRNRILKPGFQSEQYIHLGIEKPSYGATLNECILKDTTEWQDKIFRQLEHYKESAPFYNAVIDLLHRIFDYDHQTLIDFNAQSIKMICDYIGINCHFERFSDKKETYSPATHPGEWGLIVSKLYGANAYINSPGGEEFYKPEEFVEAKIRLGFIHPDLKSYTQGHKNQFTPGLSVLDALMFNSPGETLELVKSHSIDWKN